MGSTQARFFQLCSQDISAKKSIIPTISAYQLPPILPVPSTLWYDHWSVRDIQLPSPSSQCKGSFCESCVKKSECLGCSWEYISVHLFVLTAKKSSSAGLRYSCLSLLLMVLSRLSSAAGTLGSLCASCKKLIYCKAIGKVALDSRQTITLTEEYEKVNVVEKRLERHMRE